MIWLALTPLLLLGFAVGVVPVTIGIIHDHRAHLNGDAYAHLFFQPRPRPLSPSATRATSAHTSAQLAGRKVSTGTVLAFGAAEEAGSSSLHEHARKEAKDLLERLEELREFFTAHDAETSIPVR